MHLLHYTTVKTATGDVGVEVLQKKRKKHLMLSNTTTLVDLEYIDRITPVWRFKLENELSVQERKVLVAGIRSSRGDSFTLTDLLRSSRIVQRNHLSTIVGRLCNKGYLIRLQRGIYSFASDDLANYMLHRHC